MSREGLFRGKGGEDNSSQDPPPPFSPPPLQHTFPSEIPFTFSALSLSLSVQGVMLAQCLQVLSSWFEFQPCQLVIGRCSRRFPQCIGCQRGYNVLYCLWGTSRKKSLAKNVWSGFPRIPSHHIMCAYPSKIDRCLYTLDGSPYNYKSNDTTSKCSKEEHFLTVGTHIDRHTISPHHVCL